jgi:hypothetical protein
VVLVLTLFAYLPPSKISGQTLYESMVYAGYNFFLGWPIVGVGIFDRDISIPTVLKYPGKCFYLNNTCTISTITGSDILLTRSIAKFFCFL